MQENNKIVSQPSLLTAVFSKNPNKRLRLTTSIIMFVLFIAEGFCLYFHLYISAYVTIGSLASNGLFIYSLTANKKTNVKITAFLGHLIFMLLGCFAVGKNFGMYFYLFPLIFMMPTITENINGYSLKIFFCQLVAILAMIIIFIFCPPVSSWQNITETSANFFFHFNAFASLIFVGLIAVIEIDVEHQYILGIIKEKEKAEEAAQARTHFLSKMSHELRTPLNGILGAKYILEKEHGTTGKEYFNIIEQSSSRMLDLVNDVLDFNKIEANEMDLHFVNTNLLDLLQKNFLSFTEKAKQKRIKFQSEIDGRLNMLIAVDDIRLSQVLNNLLSNAIKFTVNGSVTLKATIIKESEKSVEIYIAAEDTGIGIEEDNLKNIFQSFWQVYAGSTRKYEGTGLGLSISQQLLQLMKSKLNVESVLGKGSNFFFNIIAEKIYPAIPNNDQSGTTMPSNTLDGKRILVAEDNEINLMVISKVLKMKNIELRTSVNGQEAIDCLEVNAIDLVLLDLEMPVMDGYTAIKLMKKKYPDMPVIAFTASLVDTNKYNELIRMGFDDCLTKPFKPQQVFDKIETFLVKRKYAF